MRDFSDLVIIYKKLIMYTRIVAQCLKIDAYHVERKSLFIQDLAWVVSDVKIIDY
jgi:hypothetical protein